MERSRTMNDPLGNTVQLPAAETAAGWPCDLQAIRRVVTSPAFVIQVGPEELYFIRLLDWEFTLLVGARGSAQQFVVEACIINPTVDAIDRLLEKGRLIPFP